MDPSISQVRHVKMKALIKDQIISKQWGGGLIHGQIKGVSLFEVVQLLCYIAPFKFKVNLIFLFIVF